MQDVGLRLVPTNRLGRRLVHLWGMQSCLGAFPVSLGAHLQRASVFYTLTLLLLSLVGKICFADTYRLHLLVHYPTGFDLYLSDNHYPGSQLDHRCMLLHL